jgi:Transglycosylase SLT domain
LDRMLRIAMLAITALLAAGATVAAVQGQHRTSLFSSRPAANVGQLGLMPTRVNLPLEPSGRVEEWRYRGLLAAEAEAAARAAAAQAAADARARAAARAAAAAVPAPPTVSYPAGSIQDIITKAFTPFGATAVAWGLRVAKCESGYNPRAYNGAGPYYGLFQFLMSTFKATPFGSQDIYDPVANAGAAAWKYSQGGAGAWGCK